MGLRERQRQHTIKVILDAAAQVFGQHGYHGTSMEEVARATGCATATLYGYFSSKEELFSRVLMDLIEEYLAGVHEAIADTDSFEAGVIAYFDHFLDFAERREGFLRVMLAVMRSAQPGTQPGAEQADALRLAYWEALRPLFERGAAEGLYPADLDTQPLFSLLSGSLHTSSYTWLIGLTPSPRPSVLAARALFLTGFPAAVAALSENS